MSESGARKSTLELHWVCKSCDYVTFAIFEPKECRNCVTFLKCNCCEHLTHTDKRPVDCDMCGAPACELVPEQSVGFDNAADLADADFL